MARKRARLIDDNPLAKTERAGEIEVPAEGRTLPTSTGLKESELKLLDDLADKYGVARNALMRYAVRRFLADVLNGRLDLASDVVTPEPKSQLKMP